VKKGRLGRLFGKNALGAVAALVVAMFVALGLLAPVLAPHSPLTGDLDNRLQPPFWMEGGSMKYPLGCDQLGRDVLSRIIYGSRISLIVGVTIVSLTALIGLALGLLAGFYQGTADAVLSRVVDVLLAFPFLVFALGVISGLGPGIGSLIIALTFKGWVDYYRVTRGEVMAAKATDYVLAARSIGLTNVRIMLSEILPNVVPSAIVLATFGMATMIVSEASLSFLGLGVQPPTPAWGSMVSAGREYLMTAWWISTFPGLAILALVLSINLVGEALRDALDPRLRN
jgi:ABC-type dipeptide/oligopeptide/nickel transport system permease subunit